MKSIDHVTLQKKR